MRDRHAADNDETLARPFAVPAHRNSRQDPATAAKRHFAEDDGPWDSAAGGDRSRKMQHRHKEEHHGPEQQAGPPHLTPGGDAQRCGDQGKADEIYPEHTPRHVPRHQGQQGLLAGKMFRAEDRQREGEAQVGQGYDLVDAASVGNIVLRGQEPDREQRKAGGGHGQGGARQCKEYGENSRLHGLSYLSFLSFTCMASSVATCSVQRYPSSVISMPANMFSPEPRRIEQNARCSSSISRARRYC